MATNQELYCKPRKAVDDFFDWPCWKSSCFLFSLQDSDYVIAERNFVTEDHSMLRFHKGDIIRLQVMDGLENGETLWPESCNLLIKSATEPVCTCRTFSGFSYGCVVKKMVVYLEEMKRDTSDFGEDLLINLIDALDGQGKYNLQMSST